MSDMAQCPCLNAQIHNAADLLSHFIPVTYANVQPNLHTAGLQAEVGLNVTGFAAVLSISVAAACARRYLSSNSHDDSKLTM